MEQPTQIVTRPLDKGNQDDRIRAIFGLTSDDPLPEANGENLCKYHAYLTAHLTFPFRRSTGKKPGRSRAGNARSTWRDWWLLTTTIPKRATACSARFSTMPIPRNPSAWSKHGQGIGGFCLGSWGISWGSPIGKRKSRMDDENCLPLDQIEMKRSGQTGRLLADYSYWLHNH